MESKDQSNHSTEVIVASVLTKYDITPTEVIAKNVTCDDVYSRYVVEVKVDKPQNLSDLSTTYKVINEIEDGLWDAGHDNPELTLTNVDY